MDPNNSGGPALASNPANGISNIPLGGEQIEGVTETELQELLQEVLASKDNFQVLADKVANVSLRVMDKGLRQKLDTLSKALIHSNSGRTRTKDPLTGELDPTYQDIAREVNELYITSKKVSKVYNNTKLAQTVQKKKKKTRGNPFRVLMGKVGKLLDHGIEKNDIVRYLAKEKIWNKETIDRAVDIVRDYNKKKKSKDKDDNDNIKTSVSTENLVNDAKEVAEGKDELEDAITELEEIENRTATASLNYDRLPDHTKISTPELIMRACYLLDFKDYDMKDLQADYKVSKDKKGVKQELDSIKKALLARDFDKEDLKNLGLGQ